jgi:hypothetical protein
MSRSVSTCRSWQRGLAVSGMLAALTAAGCDNSGTAQPDQVEFRQSASVETPQAALDGATIPKYVEALPVFSNRRSSGSTAQNIDMVEFQQKILPASI